MQPHNQQLLRIFVNKIILLGKQSLNIITSKSIKRLGKKQPPLKADNSTSRLE